MPEARGHRVRSWAGGKERTDRPGGLLLLGLRVGAFLLGNLKHKSRGYKAQEEGENSLNGQLWKSTKISKRLSWVWEVGEKA